MNETKTNKQRNIHDPRDGGARRMPHADTNTNLLELLRAM